MEDAAGVGSAPFPVYIGHSITEKVACDVARASMLATTSVPLDIKFISRYSLGDAYTRPFTYRGGQLYDVISDAPMSTDHAIARFFIPWLRDYSGWALFTDGDVLCRWDLAQMLDHMDDRYAVMCVQHGDLASTAAKKDGAVQQPYRRKNWSSVMLINCGHPANRLLTFDRLNSVPGRDLHAFDWLAEHEIGSLPRGWNYLVGQSPLMLDPALVHYTLGTPLLSTHAHDQFSDDWYAEAIRCGYTLLKRPDHVLETVD